MFVATIFTIVSFVRFLIALFKWITWRSRCISAFGDVVGIENTIYNYDDKGLTRYKYTVMIDHEGRQYKSFLEETVRPNRESKIVPGSQVKLLYDPATTECFLTSELTSAMIPHLISTFAGMALVCLFFYLSLQS